MSVQSPRSRRVSVGEASAVCAIVGVLGASLFPVFARAREASPSATDMTAFKAINLAGSLYSEDYDEDDVSDKAVHARRDRNRLPRRPPDPRNHECILHLVWQLVREHR